MPAGSTKRPLDVHSVCGQSFDHEDHCGMLVGKGRARRLKPWQLVSCGHHSDADAYGVKIHQCADLHKVLMDQLPVAFDTSGVPVWGTVSSWWACGALYGVCVRMQRLVSYTAF
jgi:hypothetical protein